MNVFELIKEKLKETKTKYYLTIANTGDTTLDLAYQKVAGALEEVKTILDEVAKEYKSNAWLEIYDKVLQLEKRYDVEQNTEAVNDCIKLQNLLNYFKHELCEDDNDGWIFCKQELPKITNSYLVTKKCESNGKSAYETAHEIFWIKDNKWDCERDEDYEWKVIAWRNKIAPCKEGCVE